MARVQPFIATTQTMNGYRKQILSHTLSFYCQYRKVLTPLQMRLALMNSGLLFAHEFLTAPGWIGPAHKRTHISSSERLDKVYRPAFQIDPRYQHYFSPTMLTDGNGEIAADLQDDISGAVLLRNRAGQLVG
jgi:hypothetical protein